MYLLSSVNKVEGMTFALLALAETGLYEHELMELLEVPAKLSCACWQDLLRTFEEATFVCCGIRAFFNRCGALFLYVCVRVYVYACVYVCV